MNDIQQKRPPKTAEICGDCRHFRPHYIKFGRSYRAIWYGHCGYPRLKKRETSAKACEHYRPRP